LKQYYSYDNFRDDTKKLINKVKPFQADAILAIARGGMTLSHAMAEGLDIRDVQSIRTELYDNDSKRSELSLFGECVFKEEIKKVLVVDDIADSGETFAYIMEYLKTWYLIFQLFPSPSLPNNFSSFIIITSFLNSGTAVLEAK
jgi:xanthine phosphoribosyltransferase